MLIGSKGRMGQTILALAKEHVDLDIVGECDLGDAIEEPMENCDVAIDFSQPAAIEELCRVALQNRRPLVIGTTGHSAEQRRTIEKAAENLPIVFASNFSVGVNILFWLSAKASELLGHDFEPEIVETHHKMKKDAPSGTAKTLAEIIKKASRTGSEIQIKSVREGEVVGDHMITFVGPGERLELIHRAGSREIFARGTLRAARWISGKPAGLYSMQDVLGL